MTTTPQPGAWYISRDGYATRVRVTHVTPDHVTVEWHDGWGQRHTADLTPRQIATTYRPLDPDVPALLAAVEQRDVELAQARDALAATTTETDQ